MGRVASRMWSPGVRRRSGTSCPAIRRSPGRCRSTASRTTGRRRPPARRFGPASRVVSIFRPPTPRRICRRVRPGSAECRELSRTPVGPTWAVLRGSAVGRPSVGRRLPVGSSAVRQRRPAAHVRCLDRRSWVVRRRRGSGGSLPRRRPPSRPRPDRTLRFRVARLDRAARDSSAGPVCAAGSDPASSRPRALARPTPSSPTHARAATRRRLRRRRE